MRDSFNRRLGILNYLMEHGRATSRELSNIFEVSRTTIKHDMSFLSYEYITSVEGRYGGYVYKGKRKVDFTKAEALAVMKLTEAHKAELAEEAFYSIMSKLKCLLTD